MVVAAVEVVEAGGCRVRVWRAGSGQPALLYLHSLEGFPAEAAFLERLGSGRQVVVPEHPGFGQSTGIEGIDGVLDMVLFHRQLVDRLGLAQVDVVGHSLGGMFGAELAAICPERVRRLVLAAPFGLWLDEAPIPDLFVMSPNQLARTTWHEPEGEAAQQAMSRAVAGVDRIQAAVTRASNLSAAGKFLWPIPDRGLSKRLHLVQAPTLVLLGESDGLVTRAYGEAFTRAIAGASLEVIPAAGHYPMYEQTDRFVEMVEGFLG